MTAATLWLIVVWYIIQGHVCFHWWRAGVPMLQRIQHATRNPQFFNVMHFAFMFAWPILSMWIFVIIIRYTVFPPKEDKNARPRV